jgi:hypothetical protein
MVPFLWENHLIGHMASEYGPDPDAGQLERVVNWRTAAQALSPSIWARSEAKRPESFVYW